MRAMFSAVRSNVVNAIKSTTVGNTGWLASGLLVSGIVGAISSAIFARYLGLAGFGVLTLTFSVMNLFTDLADLGLVSSIVRFGSESLSKGDKSRFESVLGVVLRFKVILAGTILLCAWLFVPALAGYVFGHVDEKVAFYCRLGLIAAALNVVANVFPAIFQAMQQFRTSALVGASRFVAKLVMIFACMGLVSEWSVSLGLGIEISSLALLVVVSFAFSPVRRFLFFLRDKPLERQILDFNRWIALSQAIALLGGRLDVFFVGGLADARALGLYSAASKVAALVNVLMYSYMTVLLPEFSSNVSTGMLRGKFKHAVVIVTIMAIGVGVLGLIATPLVLVLFGKDFGESAPLLQIMCIGMTFMVLSYPMNATFFALNKSHVFPLMSGISLLAFISANLYFIPRIGVTGAAVAFSVGGAVTFLTAAVALFVLKGKRLLHISATEE
jgi:O-antigen/teichoic acid export membrane protein